MNKQSCLCSNIQCLLLHRAFRAMNDLMNSPGRPLPMSIGASRRVLANLSGAVSGLDAWSADSEWLSQLSSDLSRLQDVLQSLPQPER